MSSAHEVGFVRYKIQPLFKIGDIYEDRGNKEMAIKTYTEALKKAENSYTPGINEALKKLDLL